MIEVQELTDSMNATMCDMEKYLQLAMDNIGYRMLTDEYYDIYLHHKSDYDDLHKVAVKFINEFAKGQNTDNKVIDVMMNVWKFTHNNLEQQMDRIIEKEQRYKDMLSK